MTTCSALQMLARITVYLTAMMTASVIARSVTSSTMTSSPSEDSHLLFYLTVEKELMPQTADLASRALQVLKKQCDQTSHGSYHDCFTAAEKLPAIPALGDFPSQGALQKERSKVFIKHLLKEAHSNLYSLQKLLEAENGGVELLTSLTTQMEETRLQLKSELESYYTVRLRQRRLRRSKRRYLSQSRAGRGDCRARGDCLTEQDYHLRLFYTAYRRLMRVNHVLDYAVRLSWLALEENTWP